MFWNGVCFCQRLVPTTFTWTTPRSDVCPSGVFVCRSSATEIWCLKESSGLEDTHALAGLVQSAALLQDLTCPDCRDSHTRAARLIRGRPGLPTVSLLTSASSWLSM